MSERQRIIEGARGWIGTRWQHQGRSRAGGVDCIGLIVMVARELGIPVQDVTGYRRRQDGRQFLSEIHKQLEIIPSTDWKKGDIGVFKESSFPIHVGFLGWRNDIATVIHAHARRRQVIEEPLAAYGAPFLVFSLPEVK
ncbi:MAG: NlpC/P60 family protein [Sneathiella sp.]